MASYVPPHLRFTGESMDIRNHEPRTLEALSQNSPQPSATYNDRDILNHFWPQGGAKTPSTVNLTTLNASQDNPENLSFVLIYAAGHPKWENHGIIFTKSSLRLLPELQEKLSGWRAKNTPVKLSDSPKSQGDHDARDDKDGEETTGLEDKMKAHSIDADRSEKDQTAQDESAAKDETKDTSKEAKNAEVETEDSETGEKAAEGESAQPSEEEQSPNANLKDIPPIDYVPQSQTPVAVFYTRGHGRFGFRFVGWHTIAKIAILLPRSVELGRLMHQKWVESTARDRGGRSNLRSKDTWKSDMGREWAVIKLQRMNPASEACPEEPKIEKYRAPRKKENRAELDVDGDCQETEDHKSVNDEAQPNAKLGSGDAGPSEMTEDTNKSSEKNTDNSLGDTESGDIGSSPEEAKDAEESVAEKQETVEK